MNLAQHAAYRKKFLIYILGAAAILVNRHYGINVTDDQIVDLVDIVLLVVTGFSVERAANKPKGTS